MDHFEKFFNWVMTVPGFLTVFIFLFLIQGFTRKRHDIRTKGIFEELARRHGGTVLDGSSISSPFAGFPLGGILGGVLGNMMTMSLRMLGPMLQIPYQDYQIMIMYGTQTSTSSSRSRGPSKTIFSATLLAKGANLEHIQQILGNGLVQILGAAEFQVVQMGTGDGNNFSFTVAREGIFSNIGKKFSHEDIQVHQPEFDKTYFIKSNRENTIRELLGFDTQRALLEIKDWQPQIFGQMGLCTIEVARVLNSVEEFDNLIRLGKRLLDGLKKIK